MRILMLTQWFEPEPTFKGLFFAKELKKLGHDVCVLTGFPNYPEGKVYPGYKISLYKREEFDGIKVIRVALFPSHDRNALKRILNYVSFALSAAFLGVFLVPKSDVAYVYHPPATVGIAAWALKVFRKIPFVYDVQDIWPDTVAQSGMLNMRWATLLLGRFCKWVYQRASHVIVLSDGFKRTLIERGVKSDNISVVPNWCDEDNLKPSPYDVDVARQFGLYGKFNVVFAGGMGSAQGLDVVLKSAELLRKCHDVQFVLIGEGSELGRLKLAVKAASLPNVLFVPRQSPRSISDFLNIADVLLVHLIDDPLFKITIPSKTQAYMRMGKPILMGVQGDAENIIKECNAGLCFKPEDPESLADAVLQMYGMSKIDRDTLGQNGCREYERSMCLKKGIGNISTLLHQSSGLIQ